MVYGKFAKKALSKGKRYFKKRYLRKGSGYGTGLRLNKLAKDVLTIKRSLNTEKKYIDTGEVATTPVGQCNVNASGNVYTDITPRPPVGTGFQDRVGKSIKVVAMSLEYQLVQQTNTVGARRFCLYVIKTKGEPQGTVGTEFMDTNPITGVIDYMSNRDVNFMKKYQVIAKRNIYLKDDSLSGQAQIATGKIIMKLNHHVQFDDNTTQYTDGQIGWFIVADSGNAGTSASTLSNVAVSTALTGASLQTYSRFWYVDN